MLRFTCSLPTVAFICQLIFVHYVTGDRLTIEIGAAREECFYVTAGDSQTLYVDYYVLKSIQGPLRVNFQVVDPNGRPLLTEFQKSRSTHKIPLHKAGAYAACFDNTFSAYGVKHIRFAMSLDADKKKATWHKYNQADYKLVSDIAYELGVKEIEVRFDRVRIALDSIAIMQDEFRSKEAVDRSIAEMNASTVTMWSILSLTVIIVVGGVQILFIKSLFDERYNILKNVRKYIK